MSFEANPAASFRYIQESAGDWAACEVCHDMIEANDRNGLALRSINALLTDSPELNGQAKPIYEALAELHAMFFAN